MTKQESDRRFADQLRRLVPVLFDPVYVDVGDEIVRVGAPEDEHLDIVVGLGSPNEGDQVAHQRRPQKIHRRGGDIDEQNRAFLAYFKGLEIRVRPVV